MNRKLRWLLYAAGALALVVTYHALSLHAKAQEAEPFRGIWCVSSEKLERVVTLGKERGGAQEGIIAVNEEAEGSCFYGTIIGIRKERGNTIDSPDGYLDVVAWQVIKVVFIADFANARFIPVNMDVELVRYTLEESKSRGA